MSPSAPGILLTILTCVSVTLLPRVAAAQKTQYCRQVQARAASDAGLLMTPRVLVQGIRFPRGGQQLDAGPTTEEGFQLRTGLAFSPIDFFKGQGVLRVGDADCERHEASVRLESVLARGTDDARLPALREQVSFLRAHAEDWRAFAAKAATRLSQRIITVVEYTNVQRFVDALERKVVQVEGQANQLSARLPKGPATSSTAALGALGTDYYQQAMRFEHEASRVRQLDDWKLQITGGVIPQTPADWYGTLELSFSLGGLVRDSNEDAYIDARSNELRYAPEGVATRLEQFRAEANAALEQARRELELLQHSLEVIRATRTALETTEAESVAQARDMLAIEQLSVESDAIFLRALVDALSSLVARAQG
jgi:hypothetical protein